jgi:predicted phosphohydrolase
LRSCCILLVDSVECMMMHGLANLKISCYKTCCMQFHYVILVLSYISETYLIELPFTHTISEKNYPFWLIICACTKVHQLLPHNSLQILNYLNSGRLQSNLNVVFERLWIMTCTNL